MMQIVVTSAEELKAIIRDVLLEQTEPTAAGVQSDNISFGKANVRCPLLPKQV